MFSPSASADPSATCWIFCILRSVLGIAQHLVAATRKRDSHPCWTSSHSFARTARRRASDPARRRKSAKPPVAPGADRLAVERHEEIERRRWRGRTEIGQIGRWKRTAALRQLPRQTVPPAAVCRPPGPGSAPASISRACWKLRQRGVRAFTAAQDVGSPRVEPNLPRAGYPVPRLLWPADAATVDASVRRSHRGGRWLASRRRN